MRNLVAIASNAKMAVGNNNDYEHCLNSLPTFLDSVVLSVQYFHP
jgi:hypothetical protein